MTLTRRLLAPGWYRATLGTVAGFGVGMGIVVLVRALYGWDPILDWDAIVTVGALIAAPLGYLVGIGCFDYWFYWAASRCSSSQPSNSSSGTTRTFWRMVAWPIPHSSAQTTW